jgi:hypothetical protein
MMRRARIFSVAAAVWLLAIFQSRAMPLNLVWTDSAPDFMGSFMSVTYDANSHTFQASGSTTSYLNGSTNLDAFADLGNYILTATITPAGVLTAGSLTIDGDIGTGSETLLTGTLHTGSDGTAFGSSVVETNVWGRFEFLFTVTGGDPAIVRDFGGVGAANGGTVVYAQFSRGDTPFTGLWTSGFSDSGSQGALADTVVVPEPSSILLLLVGGIVCVVAHRATANKQVCLSC